MATEIDFEAEGLLEGVSDAARGARIELIGELLEAGVDLDEMPCRSQRGPSGAAAGGDGSLRRGSLHPERGGASSRGSIVELLDEQWRALGMAVSDPDEPTQTADELAAAKRVRGYLDAGLDPEAIRETARVMAMAMSQIAAANRQMVGELFSGDAEAAPDTESELEVARRLESLTLALVPMVGPDARAHLQAAAARAAPPRRDRGR